MVSRAKDLFEAEAGSFGDTMMAHNGVAGYKIPEYQRQYNWKQEHLRRLLADSCQQPTSQVSSWACLEHKGREPCPAHPVPLSPRIRWHRSHRRPEAIPLPPSSCGPCSPYPSIRSRRPLPLFGWDETSIQERLAPVQPALFVQGPQNSEPYVLPHSLLLPLLQAAVAGGRAAVPLGKVYPASSRAEYPENPIEGGPVVVPFVSQDAWAVTEEEL